MSKFVQKPKVGKPRAVEPTPAPSAPKQSATPTVTPTDKKQPKPQPQSPARSRRPLYKRRWLWALLVVMMGLGGGSAYVYQFWQNLEAELPESIDDVRTYTREETMRVKAADGTVIQEIGPLAHEELAIDEVPDLVVQAFIASEDRRFMEHAGVDYQGILRATWVNLRSREVVEGGSTITQQLSRIVFLSPDRAIERKLKEIRIAQKIEQDLSKEEILERYLNLVYLGSGAYGVGDAAWVYFGKTVDELTLAEAATLAGIAPAPSVYSPLENPEAARNRRNTVLARLYEEGFIGEQEYEDAIAEPLGTNPQKAKRFDRKVPYFTDYIQEQLPQHLSDEQLAVGGLTIETTINLEWQAAAEATIAEMSERYGAAQNFSQAALVAIDPRTGEVKAMVGGRDYNNEAANGQFNRVTQAKRQPGSTFKPFVYATAIAAGFSPYKTYKDAPYIVDGYEPKNYSEGYRGNVSMLNALTYSINIPAVRALIEVGWNPVIKLSQSMGIESELKPTYSLALGASEVTVLELTSAYGTIANQGKHVPVHGIKRILDRNGKVLYRAKTEGKQVLDRDSANIMTWMMQNVVRAGTATAAQIGRPVAGKTGTSDDYRDLWFVGYIPQLVAGVWLGNDDNTSTQGASSTAAAFWRDFMNRIAEDIPEEDFPERPEKLSGREATIKAEPIKPKKAEEKPVEENESEQRSTPTETTKPEADPPTQTTPRNSASPSPDANPAANTRKRPNEGKPSPAPRTTVPSPEPARSPSPSPEAPPPPSSAPNPPATAPPSPAPSAPAPSPEPAAPPPNVTKPPKEPTPETAE